MSKDAVFVTLSDLLRPYGASMIVKTDTPDNYYIEETRSLGKPQMFAAVQLKKNYVSLHLFPIYCQPDLIEGISDTLRKRMQGKSCFNFRTMDEVPLDELNALVEAAFRSLP